MYKVYAGKTTFGRAIFGGSQDHCFRFIKHYCPDEWYVVGGHEPEDRILIKREDGMCYPIGKGSKFIHALTGS
jgi:hypothetical protein